ncbi:MAG: SOS response-associated peptidase family protein [Bacteroidota bacterium]
MCYYNGVKVTRAEFIRLKSIEKAVAKYDFLNKPLHIGFDYNNIPVLKRIAGEEDFDIVEMEWGFLPPYIKTREEAHRMRIGYKKDDGQFQVPILTLNAMSEEMLLPRKIYRQAALERRCLILSTGFYEWRHIFPANKKTGLPVKTAVKYPYHIGVKDKEYFFIAGIWTPWEDKTTGEFVETVSIITTAANKIMEQIHNSKKRMPTILTEDLAWEWLIGDLSEVRISEIAKFQFPSEQMKACTIAKDFREALDPLEPFNYEDLPALEVV